MPYSAKTQANQKYIFGQKETCSALTLLHFSFKYFVFFVSIYIKQKLNKNRHFDSILPYKGHIEQKKEHEFEQKDIYASVFVNSLI
jgi:hypothetical protein